MADPITLDVDDRRVLHALQLDGRASFARIASILGMSERAVSRRYHRLRSRLALRVIGLSRADPRTHEDWFIRVGPGASTGALARSLAGRDDTSWIASLAGDDGLGCILRAPASTGDTGGILDQLRRSAGTAAVTAQRLLAPVAGVGGWPGRLTALTATEQQALASPALSTATHLDGTRTVGTRSGGARSEGVTRSDADARLLRLLATDGRMSITRLARESGMPETPVRRRIAELPATGKLLFEVEVDPRLYGRHVDVICWMDVPPSALGTVTRALESHVEVAYAATTTGSTSILAFLELSDARDLRRYLVERIGALSGVHHVETELVARWLKRSGRVLPTS
ncbi:Lrp/AsnC family transcriptional regulator [Intrasporangium mesophilum]